MTDNVITVAAYASSGSDYCRGCHMESWDSQFAFEMFVDMIEAARVIAQKKFDNEHRQKNRTSEWEIITMINGKVLDYDTHSYYSRPDIELTETEETLKGFLQERVAAELVALNEKRLAQIAAAERLKAREVDQAEKKAKAARRAAFEALKQEFGNEGST